jgi:hypothetical protein
MTTMLPPELGVLRSDHATSGARGADAFQPARPPYAETPR